MQRNADARTYCILLLLLLLLQCQDCHTCDL
jgi:hypothetical protein